MFVITIINIISRSSYVIYNVTMTTMNNEIIVTWHKNI